MFAVFCLTKYVKEKNDGKYLGSFKRIISAKFWALNLAISHRLLLKRMR